jgi:hypothetical protein
MTPSALETGLTKLRECADKTMFAEVTHEEAAALLAKIEAADRLAEFLVNLRAASRGVAGYHLNGNIAEWDEFEEMNLLAAYRNSSPAAEGGMPTGALSAAARVVSICMAVKMGAKCYDRHQRPSPAAGRVPARSAGA